MSRNVHHQNLFDKTLRTKTIQVETHNKDFYKQDECLAFTGKHQLFHWYFLAGFYTLIIPFKIRKRDDGTGWINDTWIFQKILCLLIWWPLSWVFSLSELLSRIVTFSTFNGYRPDQYFDLAYFILHLALQMKFYWVVITKRLKLQMLSNDVSAFSLFNPTELSVPLSSRVSKWTTILLNLYMVYMHLACIALVILRKLYFGTSLHSIIPISEQLLVAIKTGRKRFFLGEVETVNVTWITVNGTNMTNDIYTTENIVIGSVELTLQVIRLWNDSFMVVFFYGALPFTFWSASKRFQLFLSGINSSQNGSETESFDKEFNFIQADMILEKYRELRNLLGSLNSVWSTATFLYVLEMSLTMVVRVNHAVKSKYWLPVVYIGHLTVFLVVSLVMLAEGRRTNASFKQWLCDWYIREQVFAQRKNELEWLEKNLEVGPVGIGSVGAYEISYGFLAQMLVFTITVFLITF
ncbi:unnamed protein product [Orchesella dallaii]|uniref:Gustatory receptor n=1 Tax=Orchesella dallaii TaxID=48710 RepID=A0ABP1RP46_9HEXA